MKQQTPAWLDLLRDASYTLTQREIAAATGIHHNTVSNILNQRTRPQRGKLEKLANGVANPQTADEILRLYDQRATNAPPTRQDEIAEILRDGFDQIAAAIRDTSPR